MKAVVFEQLGGPQALSLQECPLTPPLPHEVRIQFTSIGLNRADALFREGQYFAKPSLPSRIGYEGAGVVDAIGSDVTQWKVGDRVAVLPCTPDASIAGCCAEYGNYDARFLVATPNSIADEDAGSIWMPFITAWGALVVESVIKPQMPVVISAASSSVGIAAIQIANLFDAIPIATTTHMEKAPQLEKHGAHHVVDAKADDYVSQIKELTGGKGASLIFDAVAGAMMRNHIASSAPHGKICLYGLLDRGPMEVHPGVLLKKHLTLQGYTLYPYVNHPESIQSALVQITQAFEEKKFAPVISKKFSLEDTQAAFEYLESNQQIGKVVICPKL